MGSGRFTISLSLFFSVITGILFAFAGLIMVLSVRHFMRDEAIKQARRETDIILNRNLATHHYFTNYLKPDVFSLSDPLYGEDYFDPVWMSSSYVVRMIDKEFRTLNKSGYYYKECAVNARHPENEADAFERVFLMEVNENPDIEERSAIRYFNGEPFFVTMRRGEKMEESCLRCHGVPEKAPAAMVAQYGAVRGFGWRMGAVVSAVSIRIPLSAAYAETRQISLKLSGLVLFILIIVYGTTYSIASKTLIKPITKVRDTALDIVTNPVSLGTSIQEPFGTELRDMTRAFNLMSAGLKEERESLETKVQDRTKQLKELNSALASDIVRREALEKERQKLIDDLTSALAQVKQLKDLLPICASCKRVRDDAGYWIQIEEYIRSHSDTEFTHGICPECMKKLYSDFANEKNENPEHDESSHDTHET